VPGQNKDKKGCGGIPSIAVKAGEVGESGILGGQKCGHEAAAGFTKTFLLLAVIALGQIGEFALGPVSQDLTS